MKTLSIGFVWTLRSKLRAESGRLWAESGRLRAESGKLWAESDKLLAEGDKIWAEAVLEAYGNATIEWHSETHCTIDGTDTFQ